MVHVWSSLGFLGLITTSLTVISYLAVNINFRIEIKILFDLNKNAVL